MVTHLDQRETTSFETWPENARGSSKGDFGEFLSQTLKGSDELLLRKQGDYNRSSPFPEYLPFGDLSAFQFIWTKALRLRNLLVGEVEPVNESITDSIRDLGNYARLWEAYRAWRDGSPKEINGG